MPERERGPDVPQVAVPGGQKKRQLNQMVSDMMQQPKPAVNSSETVSEPDDDLSQPLQANEPNDPSDKSDHSKSSIHKE